MVRRALCLAAMACLVVWALRITPAAANDAGWPTYGYSLANTRHVEFTRVNPENVRTLTPVWRFQTHLEGKYETSPIVIGRTMYVTTGPTNSVLAFDAVTGALKWRFTPDIGFIAPCCGFLNRGVAADGGKVFLATLDGRLVALDAQSGKKLWDTRVGDPHEGFSETMAPLAWHGVVYIGSSGGEFGIRGSFTAYRESNGAMMWRWWSVSSGWEGSYATSVHGYSLHRNITKEIADAPKYRNAWEHGGGPVWMTPALDPARAMIYLSTGNPSPSYSGGRRPGDNLYTDSIVALDALTGKMKWYYQETPHDVWDYDAASPPTLFDTIDGTGRRVPAVGEAGKTGWFYILNRENGKLIRLSQNFVPQRHIYYPPTSAGTVVDPGGFGGTTGPVSFDPLLHLAFITAFDRPDRAESAPWSPWRPGGELWTVGTVGPIRNGINSVCAINVDNGRIVWRRVLSKGENRGLPTGTLSAGKLLFVPDQFGMFYALDAVSGKTLWQYLIAPAETGAPSGPTFWQRIRHFLGRIKRRILGQPEPPELQFAPAHLNAPPVAYVVDGREYIAVAANIAPFRPIGGNAILVFALPREGTK